MRIFWIVLFSLLPFLSFSQKMKPDLKLIRHEITGESMAIFYSINLGGMVELRVYNDDKKLIFRDQYINDKIDKVKGQAIKVKLKNMKPGQYTYTLTYKKNITTNSFSITK